MVFFLDILFFYIPSFRILYLIICYLILKDSIISLI